MEHTPDRSVEQLIRDQNRVPILLTNTTCDNMLDDTPGEGLGLLNALGLDWSTTYGFYPLSDNEAQFIGEDSTDAPYGGCLLGSSMLFGGKKYEAPLVEVCYDGPDRPFSRGSYGTAPDSLCEDDEVAWAAAKRLSRFLRPRLKNIGGLVKTEKGVPDRHMVYLLIPMEWLLDHMSPFGAKAPEAFKLFVAQLFHGYAETQSANPCPICGRGTR